MQGMLVKASRSYDNLKSGKEVHNTITLAQRQILQHKAKSTLHAKYGSCIKVVLEREMHSI